MSVADECISWEHRGVEQKNALRATAEECRFRSKDMHTNRIHIFTTVVNRPDFVLLQDKLFKKFLQNDYVFHVVDTSLENSVSQEFRNICADNNISYYKKPENTSTSSQPGQIVSAAVQWTYDNLILDSHKNDIVCFFDSDMFLIDKFDVEEYLIHEVIAGVPQKRGTVTYMWVGIMFFNMPKVVEMDPDINFSDGFVEGYLTDTGGHTWYYFTKNKVTMKTIDVDYPMSFNDIELQNEELTNGYNFELYLDGKFFHYRAASNWHSNFRGSQDPLPNKTEVFNQIIKAIFSEELIKEK
jgi:hypothetical protein